MYQPIINLHCTTEYSAKIKPEYKKVITQYVQSGSDNDCVFKGVKGYLDHKEVIDLVPHSAFNTVFLVTRHTAEYYNMPALGITIPTGILDIKISDNGKDVVDLSNCKDYFIHECASYIEVTALVNYSQEQGYTLISRDKLVVEMQKQNKKDLL